MNKKIILLPILVAGLLIGCQGKNQPSNSESPVTPETKELWEEDLVEGESSFAEVIAAIKGLTPDGDNRVSQDYFKVRGSVVFNSGSTLGLYRNGKFLYCYNFNADSSATGNTDIEAHPVGSYVEVVAKGSQYKTSPVQLFAYTNNAYDPDAKLKVLAENKAEPYTPGVITTAENLTAALVDGGMYKFTGVKANGDYTINGKPSANLDMEFVLPDGETKFPVRVEKYAEADHINPFNQTIEKGATFDMVVWVSQQSNGNCRSYLGAGCALTKTADAVYPEPTGVTVTAAEGATEVEATMTLQLTAVVAPEGAKQNVTWTTSDAEKATVDQTGLVTGVAAGPVVITATAKEGVAGSINLTVTPHSEKTYTALESFRFTSSLTAYTAYNAEQMTAFLKASSNLGANTNLVDHSIDNPATNPLIGGNGGSGDTAWSNYNLLKLGSASKASNITFNFTSGLKIGKAVLKAVGWPDKTCNLSVGGSAAQQVTSATHAQLKDGIANESVCAEYTFEFKGTNAVSFNASLCVMVTSVTFYTVEGEAEEVLPIGNFMGHATALDDSSIFVVIALANEAAFVEVGASNPSTKVYTTYTVAANVVTITDDTLGTITANYDAANNALTQVTLSGSMASLVKDNGQITLNNAPYFWDCEGTTAELNAVFGRRIRPSGAWQAALTDIAADTTNVKAGESAVVREGSTEYELGLTLRNDFAEGKSINGIGFWVYNPSANDITLRTWYFTAKAYASNGEFGQMTAKANGWTFCRMGVSPAKTVYNFNICDWNKTGVALTFDNICLY